MSALSEHTVKQLALGYLRNYYRLRPRSQDATMLTGLDMRGAGNIIADGFLRYTNEDGSVFSVTFEATSYATRDEIIYRPRKSHVFWDALAFAFLLLPSFLAIAHIAEQYPLVGLDFYRRILILLSTLPLWVAVYYFLFRRLPRYRYIFAVEQFKQYHADDQWVAYGYDVFADKPPRYRRQLIKQCTRYGFGVVEITAQRKPKLIMAPSQAENFVPKQSFLNLLPLAQFRESMAKMTDGPWQKFKAFVRKQLQPVQSRYFRFFPRTYYAQWALTFAGLLVTLLLIRVEYQRLPIVFANAKRYKKQVLADTEGQRRETEYYKVDAPEPSFYDSTFAPYAMHVNEEQFHSIIQTEGSVHADSISLPPLRILSGYPGEEMAMYYSCDRYNALHQPFQLLIDTTFSQLSAARKRVSQLNERGLIATAVWPPCLGRRGDGYLVYIDEIMIDSTSGTQLRDSLQSRLDTLDRRLRLRTFQPLTNAVQ